METINGTVFKGMLLSGSCNLNNRKKEVDALNVFPVPDGDTGTNMSMTFSNGISEVTKSGSEDLAVIAKTLSRGLLMGARGNSGVILSQIFRGFYQSVGEKKELSVAEFSEALFNGAKVAYKAVMRPVEGTILTVVRESTEYADIYVKDHPECTINEYFDLLCKEAKASLDRTPELLPILKEARVVDSGGTGLLTIFDGFKAYLDGHPFTAAEASAKASEAGENHDFGYDAEFTVRLSEHGKVLFREDKFRKQLAQMGESIVIIQDNDLVKVQLHTLTPGETLNIAQRYGEFTRLHIVNVQEEAEPAEPKKEEPAVEEKEYAIIAVAAGEGLRKLFTEYRADIVVSGGQTMNPSTEDFVSAIKKVHAKHIYILPNNSNIIMAAKQAADVTEGADVHVFETRSVPQGLSACIAFNPDADHGSNLNEMNEAIARVHTGSVTYAIKDTSVDGKQIHQGDFMGIFEKDIVNTSKDKVQATCELLDKMLDSDCEIVTLIRGSDATEEECRSVEEHISANHSVDVDVENGGQPVYSFIIGVE